MEIIEHTITFRIEPLNNLTLTIQQAEELYNLLHKELKKDSGVIFNSPNYRDLRMPEPIYATPVTFTSETIS